MLMNKKMSGYKKKIMCFLLLFSAFIPFKTWCQDSTFSKNSKIISTVFANYHLLSEGNNAITEFQILRAYLGYEYHFSKEIKSIIIMDFGDPQILENKFKMTGFLKNAYIQYKSDFFIIEFGLIPTRQMQLSEQLWQRRYIIKSFEDQQNLGYTADYGLTFEFAPLPNLSFDFGVLNGKGHTDPSHDQNIYRRNLGLSYLPSENINTRLYWDITNSDSTFRKTYSALVSFQNNKMGICSEFVFQESFGFVKNKNVIGFSSFGHIKLNEVWTYFMRYDRNTSNTLSGESDRWNNDKNGHLLLFGVENILAKGVKISPNIRLFLPESKNNDIIFGLFLNLEAKI